MKLAGYIKNSRTKIERSHDDFMEAQEQTHQEAIQRIGNGDPIAAVVIDTRREYKRAYNNMLEELGL